jgi:hypothetical protein
VAAALFVLTVGQLAVATFASSLPQFEGKAFGARLVFYPCLMALLPAAVWVARRRTRPASEFPWGASALVMAPFFVDVTGNTLDLYDTVTWWDDANHFVNWLLLTLGLGLLLARQRVRPAWLLPVVVTGLGAILAIGWELGEWYTFIRHGTELDTAYTDTLGDLTLGLSGSTLTAAVAVAIRFRRAGTSGARAAARESSAGASSRAPS